MFYSTMMFDVTASQYVNNPHEYYLDAGELCLQVNFRVEAPVTIVNVRAMGHILDMGRSFRMCDVWVEREWDDDTDTPIVGCVQDIDDRIPVVRSLLTDNSKRMFESVSGRLQGYDCDEEETQVDTSWIT